MNARFRIGKKYRFNVLHSVFIAPEELTYVGYQASGADNLFGESRGNYLFKVGDGSPQICPAEWLVKGFVEVKHEQN